MDLDKMKHTWDTQEGPSDPKKELSPEVIDQYIRRQSMDSSSGINTMTVISIVIMIMLIGFFTFGLISFYQNLLMFFICGIMLAFTALNLYLSFRLYQRLQSADEESDLRTALIRKIEIIQD